MNNFISIFLISVISVFCFSSSVIAQDQGDQFNPATIFLLLDDLKAGDLCSSENCSTVLSCQDASCLADNSCSISLKVGFCLILDTCYADGTVKPENQCQLCDASSPDSWTNTGNNSSCNDGDACTHSDSCSSGTCVGTLYSCNDGNPNTQDICLGDGTCNNPLIP